jgi:FkbM family methyltransferase
MGLHREFRRLKQLGAAGFVAHHALSPRLVRDILPGRLGSDLLVLRDLVLWVENWREAWGSFKTGAPMPALRLRGGLTLVHEADDQPLVLLGEVFTQRCYRRYIVEPEHGVLIDIGANIGMVTLDWASRIPHAVIHAYEPNPATFRTLQRNITGNGFSGRVRLYNEAVSGRAGEVTLHRTGMSTTASVFAFCDDDDDPDGAQSKESSESVRRRPPAQPGVPGGKRRAVARASGHLG